MGFVKTWYIELFNTEFPIPEESYSYLVLAAGVVEVLGALMFYFNTSAGAFLLALYLVIITPIMHNYWDLEGKEG